jgi:ATP-dependent Clp protease ATP-binding subunit ClpB
MPQELDEFTRRMTQLQIEKQALSREDDPGSRQRLGVIESEIAELQEKIAGLKAQWESEKNVHHADERVEGEARGDARSGKSCGAPR